MTITVRKATKNDMSDILEMIQELADFENMSDEPQQKLEDLFRDGGFEEDPTTAPLFIAFVAVDDGVQPDSDGKSQQSSLNKAANGLSAIAFSVCYNTYSTWQGKALFIEDLYVRPSHRSRGIGKLIFTEIMRYSKDTGCKRVDFHVLDWNPARNFYHKMKAIDVTETEGWRVYRVNEDMIRTF